MSSIGIYTPAKTIVAMTLDELDKSNADFDKIWILVFRFLTYINFDVSGQTKTVRLPVLGNNTVPFPADMVSWTKIGLLDEKGQINTLRVNNALTTFRDNNPNRLQNLTPNINDGVGQLAYAPFYSNYYYGGDCFQLYGLDNGVITYGDCKVDTINKVIILGIDFRYDSIMLEYLSVPQMDDDYQIFTCLVEAAIAFAKWKLKQGTYQEYIAALIIGRRSLPKKRVDLQTINQVIRESQGFKLRS